MYDLQKANMWKRISAAIFDFIILTIFVLGFAWCLTTTLDYNKHVTDLQGHHDRVEAQFGVDFDITAEEYEALPKQEKDKFLAAEEVFKKDIEANRTYSILFNLTLIIVTFSILLSYLFLEFVVPLIFKNGQTLGKKIFGIGVMRSNGVRINSVVLFVRTVLGKYTIETMIPVLLCIMIFFNAMSFAAVVGIAVLFIIQLVLVIATRERTPLHDKLASTVAVDFASQMIFDSEQEMLEYKQRIHLENSALKER